MLIVRSRSRRSAAVRRRLGHQLAVVHAALAAAALQRTGLQAELSGHRTCRAGADTIDASSRAAPRCKTWSPRAPPAAEVDAKLCRCVRVGVRQGTSSTRVSNPRRCRHPRCGPARERTLEQWNVRGAQRARYTAWRLTQLAGQVAQASRRQRTSFRTTRVLLRRARGESRTRGRRDLQRRWLERSAMDVQPH